MGITTAQVERIADYKRIEPETVVVAQNGTISCSANDDIIGYYRESITMAFVDKPRGYMAIESDGTFRFRDGWYHRTYGAGAR